MAIDKPVKVPQKEITSIDVTDFSAGLDLNGAVGIKNNALEYGRNVMADNQGNLTYRPVLKRWLPDTVGPVYEVSSNLYQGNTYHFVADDGKIKYCQTGDVGWTEVGGANAVTTGTGIITTFIRVLDCLLVLNGVDKLRYVKLSDMTMVQFSLIADPSAAPTAAATGLTLTGNFKIYYGISFNGQVGQTKLSPILTSSVSKARGQWKTDGTEAITVTRNNTAPTDARSWNLFVSTAPAGASIQTSDMLLLAEGLDINTTTFVDNGTFPINLERGTAPEDNSTDGPIAKYGRESEGRPILYGIKGKEYSLLIGGDGEHALDFSPNNGGYEVELNKGTNYFPSSVIGFRNGQGIPSLTALFSNTQGMSKQSILEQQTVTYGNMSFVVWTVTEQNYGAAGVSSPYAVVNYNGGLHFPSVGGLMTMNTEASLQNVLSTKRISKPIEEYMRAISTDTLGLVVGTAWNDRVYWTVPSYGSAIPNQILTYDLKDGGQPGAFFILDIPAQWVGTVSPNDSEAFIYVTQGNSIYKLQDGYTTFDETSAGIAVPFPTEARGSLMGVNEAKNAFMAVVQAVFYLDDFIGDVTIGVNYRNLSGKIKTKEKLVKGPSSEVAATVVGGWSDPNLLFDSLDAPLSWDDNTAEMTVSGETTVNTKITKREPLSMNVVGSEFQYFIKTGLGYNAYTLRSVSYEGEVIGIKADLR